MNDLLPIAVFAGCLLATLGLARMCDWLRPIAPTPRSTGPREESPRHKETGQ